MRLSRGGVLLAEGGVVALKGSLWWLLGGEPGAGLAVYRFLCKMKPRPLFRKLDRVH